MSVRDYFSEADLEAIRAATEAAERRTSGELVCVIVARSDTYDEVRWLAATVGAFFGILLTAYGLYAVETWTESIHVWIALVPVAVSAACWLLASAVPAIRRELAGPVTLQERVHQRAAAAFVDEEVFNTRERTGILVFVSLFERRVEILTDEGIRRQVADDAWREIVERLTAGLRDGHAREALVSAVERCADLLEAAGFERPPDDVNELPDEPRLPDG